VLLWLARQLEAFLYARAALILVNSPAYVDFLQAQGVPAQKIRFIAYGADCEVFNPRNDGSQLRQSWGMNGEFVALYAGAMGQANDLHVLLDAAEALRGEPTIRLVLAGDGKQRPALQAESTRRQLDNVLFTGTYPKAAMPQVLAAADVCLAVLQDIPAFTMTYPNKVFDGMAAGKATLLAIDGVIRQVLEQAGGGWFVPPGDGLALAQAIRRAAADREATRQMGLRASQYVCRNFNRQQKMAETRAVLYEVAGR